MDMPVRSEKTLISIAVIFILLLLIVVGYLMNALFAEKAQTAQLQTQVTELQQKLTATQ